MRLKAVIVESLGREDLRRVVESLGIEGADRRSAESMRAAVGACGRATAESLLGSENSQHRGLTTLFNALLYHLMTGKVRVHNAGLSAVTEVA